MHTGKWQVNLRSNRNLSINLMVDQEQIIVTMLKTWRRMVGPDLPVPLCHKEMLIARCLRYLHIWWFRSLTCYSDELV